MGVRKCGYALVRLRARATWGVIAGCGWDSGERIGTGMWERADKLTTMLTTAEYSADGVRRKRRERRR